MNTKLVLETIPSRPAFLVDLIDGVAPVRPLRSADSVGRLAVSLADHVSFTDYVLNKPCLLNIVFVRGVCGSPAMAVERLVANL